MLCCSTKLSYGPLSCASKLPATKPVKIFKFALIKVSKNIKEKGRIKQTEAMIISFLFRDDNDDCVMLRRKIIERNNIGLAVNKLKKAAKPTKK
ncbi:hypothetical protein J4443_02885 [Candidatus Woesearchaeota archaeon]|nr:hypothetical protein [Candidatus Woesearchaeota archaeon]